MSTRKGAALTPAPCLPAARRPQTILLPLQADISNTPVTSALNVANCAFSLSSLVYIRWAGKAIVPVTPGAPLNIAIPQAVGVGSTNVMMAGGCEPYCLWNSELTVDDNEFAIELEDLPAWTEDVKKITRMDLQENGRALDRCARARAGCWRARQLHARAASHTHA